MLYYVHQMRYGYLNNQTSAKTRRQGTKEKGTRVAARLGRMGTGASDRRSRLRVATRHPPGAEPGDDDEGASDARSSKQTRLDDRSSAGRPRRAVSSKGTGAPLNAASSPGRRRTGRATRLPGPPGVDENKANRHPGLLRAVSQGRGRERQAKVQPDCNHAPQGAMRPPSQGLSQQRRIQPRLTAQRGVARLTQKGQREGNGLVQGQARCQTGRRRENLLRSAPAPSKGR